MQDKIKEKLLDYLKEHEVKINTRTLSTNKVTATCPLCKSDTWTAHIFTNHYLFSCSKCGKRGLSIVDFVRILEKDKSTNTDDQIFEYLGKKYGLIVNTQTRIEELFEYYEKNNFDLVAVTNAGKGKACYELEWEKKNHKEVLEWNDWLNNRSNFGVKTGSMSGVTVIDIDVSPSPEEILKLVKGNKTLYQKTRKGIHLFYKYDPEIPTTRLDALKIDIKNDGGYVVVEPSVCEGHIREMVLNEIAEIPPKLKEFILNEINKDPKFGKKNKEDQIKKIINPDDDSWSNFKLDLIGEGDRHNAILRLGGMFYKKLNMHHTEYVLNILNKHLCSKELPYVEIKNIVRNLSKYYSKEEKEVAHEILEYLSKVKEGTARDVKDALGFSKDRVDLALAWLEKEDYIVKHRRMFKVLQKTQWKDTFMDDGKVFNIKVPFFDDVCIFRQGDLIIVGGKPGTGKSHIALSMVKRFVDQKIKPKYISIEPGNRFKNVAQSLGLKEGDFDWTINFDPATIELDENSFTILDWLLPTDYAETDKLYKHFAEQLQKKKGLLIVFVQLKWDGEFYAKNMIDMFPALVSKFLYDSEDGMDGHFEFSKIREAKRKTNRFGHIQTKYVWDTKELLTLEEYQDYIKKKEWETKQRKKDNEKDTKDDSIF